MASAIYSTRYIITTKKKSFFSLNLFSDLECASRYVDSRGPLKDRKRTWRETLFVCFVLFLCFEEDSS